MKIDVYGRLKNSVARIDDVNTSADNISELLNQISAGKSKAKFIVYGEGGTSTTELTKETSEKICKLILEGYHDFIRKEQEQMSTVLNSAIDSRLHADTTV